MNTCQLTVLQGKKQHLGQIFLIQEDHERLLGRSSVCNFTVNDPMVSGMHCLFTFKGGFLVKDLLSANGVYLNDKLVDQSLLTENDVLKIGKTVFEFSIYRGSQAQGKTYITGDAPNFMSDSDEMLADDEEEKEEVARIPEKGAIPLGRLIKNHRDINVCRLAIKNSILTHDRVRECISIQQELASIQIKMTIAEILVEREFLKSQDIERLLHEHSYYKILNKDYYFGKVTLKNKLVTEEKLTECLEIQKSYLAKTEQIPRLGEIMVRKNYLSIHQNNQIIKAIMKLKAEISGEEES